MSGEDKLTPEEEERVSTALSIDSTSDERISNNVMRHEYKVLSETEKHQMKFIKDLGLEFHEYIDNVVHGDSRELSLAKTKIEEAVMWAVKHITK